MRIIDLQQLDKRASEQAFLILSAASHDRHLLRTTTGTFLLVAQGRAQPFNDDLDDYRN
ncbi:MAG: hypothetical protein HC889_11905 [Synechococcaceae cyanobacterium SM1_2_3]|nr:hypothetical protein [Synechococcaceae cyanobacterium SM1_2_3]